MSKRENTNTDKPYRVKWGWSYYEDHATFDEAKASADACAARGAFTGKSYEDRPCIMDMRLRNDSGLFVTIYRTWDDEVAA